ncbi:MAG: DUF262 domain-containing protein [Actinomycetes bacterium]
MVNNRKLTALFDQATYGSLRLPNFQREFVWEVPTQKRLAASLLLRIPLGATLFLGGSTTDFSARLIGARDQLPISVDPSPCTFVLDGQQRLSTLYHLIGDPFGIDEWDLRVRQTFPKLQHRWVVRVTPPATGGTDLFGLHSLAFKGLPMEPDVVVDAIEAYKVRLGEGFHEAWHHPAFRPAPDAGAEATTLERVRLAAAAGEVPLWRIREEGKSATSLHRQVLRVIANRRADEIEAELKDGSAGADVVDALVARLPELAGLATAKWPDGSRKQVLSEAAADWAKEVGDLLGGCADEAVPVMELESRDIDRAIVIFESMNQGGTPLSHFDLLNARIAIKSPDKNLNQLLQELIVLTSIEITSKLLDDLVGDELDAWTPRDGRIATAKGLLTSSFKDSFLGLLSVVAKLSVPGSDLSSITVADTKPARAIDLGAEEVYAHWETAGVSLLRAWAFLQIRCGVRTESDLRNKMLLLPLAVTLRGEDAMRNQTLLNRLEYFYWSSVLTSTYTERQNENALEDAKALAKWVGGTSSENPFTKRAADALHQAGYADDATLLRTDEGLSVKTDVGDYLLQYELSRRPKDLLEPKSLRAWVDDLEDHHLVPLGSATKIGQSTREIRRAKDGIGKILNSPLNRAFISAEANGRISSMEVSRYMDEVPEACRINRMLPDKQDLKGLAAEDQAREVMSKRLKLFREALIIEFDHLLGVG